MISNTIITNMASAGLTSAFLMEIMTVFVIIRMSDWYCVVLVVYIFVIILAIAVPVVTHVQLPEGVAFVL